MKATQKKYERKDYTSVIKFLRKLYETSPNPPYWLPQRWEYAEYLVSPLHSHRGVTPDWKETLYYWESEDHEIVSIVGSEYPNGTLFIHTHPDYVALEKEVITFAEKEIIPKIMKLPEIAIECETKNTTRRQLLEKMGYTKKSEVEYLNWRDLHAPISEVPLPDGYTINDMQSDEGVDLKKKIACVTGAFDSKPYPVSFYKGLQKAASYREEYDLYTTDENGDICSFCTIWYDKELNIGYFEPVGTDAEHRRKGLGRATLNEGLRRLKNDNVAIAFVGASGRDRMKFYDKTGFDQRIAVNPWTKTLK